MTTAQMNQAVSEATSAILAAFEKHDKEIRRRLTRIEKTLSGETPDSIPWHTDTLTRDQQVQIDAVDEFMKERAGEPKSIRNINFGCRVTYRKLKEGFETWQQLKSYCYRPHVRDYLESIH